MLRGDSELLNVNLTITLPIGDKSTYLNQDIYKIYVRPPTSLYGVKPGGHTKTASAHMRTVPTLSCSYLLKPCICLI